MNDKIRSIHSNVVRNDHKSPFMVTIFLRHRHQFGIGFDTEVLVPATMHFASSATEMIKIARDTLVPAQYDPALISVVVDPLEESKPRATG